MEDKTPKMNSTESFNRWLFEDEKLKINMQKEDAFTLHLITMKFQDLQ